MRRLLFASSLIFLFAVTYAAQNSGSACPKVSVVGPAGLTSAGDALVFTANVTGASVPSPIRYSWTTSAGIISSGQGSASIVVQTTRELAGSAITATVQVEPCGVLDAGRASATADVARVPECGLPAGEYRKIRWPDEQARLANLLVQLKNDPQSTAFLYMTTDDGETLKATKDHIAKILKFVKKLDRTFDLGRLTFAVERTGEVEPSTKLWIVPPGADFPKCSGICTLINGRDLPAKE